MADREGFEPSNGYQPLHTFQACALNHSATCPGAFEAGATKGSARNIAAGPQKQTDEPNASVMSGLVGAQSVPALPKPKSCSAATTEMVYPATTSNNAIIVIKKNGVVAKPLTATNSISAMINVSIDSP